MSIHTQPVAVIALCLAAGSVAAGSLASDLERALESSELDLGFRYRYESVDQDAFANDADANTLRTRLTVAPKVREDWGFLIEVDDVRRIGGPNYDDTRNGQTDRPQVLDPRGTDLNQMLVSYTGVDDLALVAGRQRIQRLNDRFIGNVGWRQNEQTYDAVSAAYAFNGRLSAFYSHVFQVNRIVGPDAGTPPEDLSSSSNLLDLQYVAGPGLTATGYAYLLDFEDADVLSNATYGLRLNGAQPLTGDLKLSWTGEYAWQQDHGDNPVDYEADYYLVEAGIGNAKATVKAGLEVLEGGRVAGEGFRTPLATLHAFQGWADKFATVSTNGSLAGIEDFYVSVLANAAPFQLTLTYHDFDAESGGGSLGREADIAAGRNIGEHYAVLLKLARYSADNFADDTTKLWLMLTAQF